MTLDKFDDMVTFATAVLNTFSPGKFPNDTAKLLDSWLSNLSSKPGTPQFVDVLIELEEGLIRYRAALASYKTDFVIARKTYKQILTDFRRKLINVQPYGSSKSMELLSKLVGLPWP